MLRKTECDFIRSATGHVKDVVEAHLSQGISFAFKKSTGRIVVKGNVISINQTRISDVVAQIVMRYAAGSHSIDYDFLNTSYQDFVKEVEFKVAQELKLDTI